MKQQTFYIPAFLDILRSHKKSFIATAVLSGFAIFLQLVAIQSFIIISSDNNQEVSFFLEGPFFYSLLSSKLVLWSAFILSGIVSVCAMYVIKIISVNVMINYEVFCVNRLAKVISEKFDIEKIDYGTVNVLMSKDCRFGGRMAYELSNVVFPISSLMLLFPYLMFLEPGLTALIFSLLFVIGAGQLKFSSKSELIASNMELHAKDDKLAKKNFFQLLEKGEFDSTNNSNKIPSPVFMETYRQRLMIPHKGNFIGGAQFIIVLTVIGVWFSFVSEERTPTDILIYSIICLISFSQAKTIPKSIANSIVFFSYFKRAFNIFINPSRNKDVTWGEVNKNNSDDKAADDELI